MSHIETLEHDIAGGVAETLGLSDNKRQWIYEFVKEQIKRHEAAKPDTALLDEMAEALGVALWRHDDEEQGYILHPENAAEIRAALEKHKAMKG